MFIEFREHLVNTNNIEALYQVDNDESWASPYLICIGELKNDCYLISESFPTEKARQKRWDELKKILGVEKSK